MVVAGAPDHHLAGRSLAERNAYPKLDDVTVDIAGFRLGAHRQPCRCRECHPGSSGGVLVFVENAAESIAASDIEVVESVPFGHLLGERA